MTSCLELRSGYSSARTLSSTSSATMARFQLPADNTQVPTYKILLPPIFFSVLDKDSRLHKKILK